MTAYLRGKKVLLLLSGVLLWLGSQGCATRGWVTEQMTPLAGRVSEVEARVHQSSAKADRALDRLDNLRLEKRMVLSLKDGATFAVNSDGLTEEGKRAIDRFLRDVKDTNGTMFLVAGHTDSSGPERYNYELGQKRATSVARYLITRKRVDPLRVSAVSYGEAAPLANNTTREGRHKNRRIEILVYKEAIASSPGRQQLELRPTG